MRNFVKKFAPFLTVSLLAVGTLTLSSCAGGGGGGVTSADRSQNDVTIALSTTEIVQGKNRLTFGIYRSATDQVKDATAAVSLAKDGKQTKNIPLRYVGDRYADKGLYIGNVEIPETGAWTAMVSVDENGKKYSSSLPIEVLSESETPAIGSKAPRTKNILPSSSDKDVYYCSATPPCSMHEHEIGDALDRDQPLLILFAAPGRCVSELCGPQLAITEKLKKEYKGRVEFIHVEIYASPETEEVVPAAYEWGLPTEPWTFLIDRDGVVSDKFEGPVLEDELRPALDKIVG